MILNQTAVIGGLSHSDMLLGCHHIELNVCKLERSYEFYSMLSGFFSSTSRLEFGGEGWFQWQFADLYIHFNQVADRYAEPAYHRKHVGLDHLAFKVDSKEEVDRIDALLRANGIPILYPAAMYGQSYYAIYIEDPDRIKLEFGADLE